MNAPAASDRIVKKLLTPARVRDCLAMTLALLFSGAAHAQQSQGTQPKDVGLATADIERRTGAKGELSTDEGVFKVNLPRGDLKVSAAGVKLTPPLGLTAWAAFKRIGDATVVMGDIVLLEDQVNPVMSVALENGLEVTALHNHFFWDSPKVMFMHIGGMGEAGKLADAVGKVFARLKETAGGKGEVPTRGHRPRQDRSSTPTQTRCGARPQGRPPRTASTRSPSAGPCAWTGTTVGKAMGVNTWAAFAGTRRAGGGRRRLRDAGERAAGRAQGAARPRTSTSSPSTTT